MEFKEAMDKAAELQESGDVRRATADPRDPAQPGTDYVVTVTNWDGSEKKIS